MIGHMIVRHNDYPPTTVEDRQIDIVTLEGGWYEQKDKRLGPS